MKGENGGRTEEERLRRGEGRGRAEIRVTELAVRTRGENERQCDDGKCTRNLISGVKSGRKERQRQKHFHPFVFPKRNNISDIISPLIVSLSYRNES
jgi:hypothetical protein